MSDEELRVRLAQGRLCLVLELSLLQLLFVAHVSLPQAFRVRLVGFLEALVREVDVTMENLTFSKRRVRIRGDVRPGLPRQLRARRTTSTAGAIWFMKALPRGAKVRGYQAVCRAGSHVVRGSTAASPVRLRGLRAARYSCTVQAKSKAGLGRIARASIPPR